MRASGARIESARTGFFRYMPGQVTSTFTRLYSRFPPPVPQLPVEPVVVTQPIDVLIVYRTPSMVRGVDFSDTTLKMSERACTRSISWAARFVAASRAVVSPVSRLIESIE